MRKLKVEKYKIKGWKKKETGLLVSENDEWILVKFISGDYLIDGYKIYRKKFIEKRKSGSEEQKKERVLKLKKVKAVKPSKFEFGKISEVLEWIETKYGLFEFQDYDEKQLFYGKINQIKKNKLIIDFIKSDGQIDVKFDSDYFRSVVLMMNDVEK